DDYFIVLDYIESPEALSIYVAAKNVVLKEGTSMGFVLTDTNPNGRGKAVHTVADNYTIKH
ncbi:unnamed protein product, partial [Allacma fusca]